jgi:VanZ family protein
MNILFSTLSAAYIAGIFLFADSPMVSDVETFNPYSLLHIPLYGILTFLLLLSVAPYKRKITKPMTSTDSMNSIKLAGLIALGVGIADEIHQVYLPGRNASMFDVFLDAMGIGFCILVFLRFGRKVMEFFQRKLS